MTVGRPGKPATVGSRAARCGLACARCRCRLAYRQVNTMLEGR